MNMNLTVFMERNHIVMRRTEMILYVEVVLSVGMEIEIIMNIKNILHRENIAGMTTIRSKRIHIIAVLLLCMIPAAVLSGRQIAAHAQETEDNTIYQGIYLGNVDVGGLTKQEALDKYHDYLAELGNVELEFQLEDTQYSFPVSELSLSAKLDQAVEDALAYGRSGNLLMRYREITDISHDNVELPIEITFNEDYITERIHENFEDYVTGPTEAGLSMSSGALTVVPGSNGTELDDEANVQAVWDVIDSWQGEMNAEIQVATIETEPTHSTEELSSVTDVIGSFETTYSSSDASRNNNIANAASKINGHVIYPGEEFDTMSHLVPFTEANGWSYAGAYLNGEVISDIGGGICQVSTTLYNAVLRAELEVTERYPHSMAVGYVQLSADAALNEGTKNFCFRNSTEYPVYISAYAGSGVLHVSIYGRETRPSNRTVEYKNEILEVRDAGEPIETIDESLPSDYREVTQSAHTGYVARLWKYVYENGELVDSIQVNSSTYAASPQRVTIGKPGEEAPPEDAASTEASEEAASTVSTETAVTEPSTAEEVPVSSESTSEPVSEEPSNPAPETEQPAA